MHLCLYLWSIRPSCCLPAKAIAALPPACAADACRLSAAPCGGVLVLCQHLVLYYRQVRGMVRDAWGRRFWDQGGLGGCLPQPAARIELPALLKDCPHLPRLRSHAAGPAVWGGAAPVGAAARGAPAAAAVRPSGHAGGWGAGPRCGTVCAAACDGCAPGKEDSGHVLLDLRTDRALGKGCAHLLSPQELDFSAS